MTNSVDALKSLDTHFCWHFMVAWGRQRRQAAVVLDPTVFPGRQDVEGQCYTIRAPSPRPNMSNMSAAFTFQTGSF